MAVDRLPVIARSTSYACPNDCGNGVSRSDKHPTWHCWRCRVDAVEVEYVTLRAADYEGAVSLLDDVTDVLARVIGPEPPKSAEIDAVLRRALAERHLRGQSETPAASDEEGRNA